MGGFGQVKLPLQVDPRALRILKAIFKILRTTGICFRLSNEVVHLAKGTLTLRELILGSLQLSSQFLVREGEAVIHHLVTKKALVQLSH